MNRVALVAVLWSCGSGGGFPDAPKQPPPPDPGTISVAWSLKTAAGATRTCAQANATTVTVAITDEATGSSIGGQPFTCGLASAISGALPIGTYTLGFTLSGAAGSITTAPAQTGVVVQSDKTTDAMAVVFVVN